MSTYTRATDPPSPGLVTLDELRRRLIAVEAKIDRLLRRLGLETVEVASSPGPEVRAPAAPPVRESTDSQLQAKPDRCGTCGGPRVYSDGRPRFSLIRHERACPAHPLNELDRERAATRPAMPARPRRPARVKGSRFGSTWQAGKVAAALGATAASCPYRDGRGGFRRAWLADHAGRPCP